MNEKREKFLSKLVVILFYLGILLFFLYSPKIYNFFFRQSKVINVFTFTDMIPSSLVEEFENKTGIKVRLKYFDSNEELLAKLKIDKGAGYDLITSSDFVIESLRRDGLLKKIDKTKVSNFSNLDTRLLNRYFDPDNIYSLPIAWSLEGIVYRKDLFEKNKNKIDWDFVYKKPVFDYKICMPDGVRDCVFLTAVYLYSRIDKLADQELDKIREVLVDQKKWVEIYMSGSLQYYLLADIVPMAVCSSAFAKKMLEASDKFNFVVPSKGSIFFIENLAIPVESKQEELTYQFINFLISPENSALNFAQHGYNPANKKAYKLIDKKFLNDNNFFPTNNMFSKLYLITNEIDPKKLEDLWLAVKLAKS